MVVPLRVPRARFLVLLSVGVGVLGCTEAVRLGADRVSARDAGASGAGGSGPIVPVGGAGGDGDDAGPRTPVDAGPCVEVACGGSTLACGDCQDDDGDGLIDSSDPDCLGPCDDSESGLYNGTQTRVTGSCRADCYFDRNAGVGDDGCSWSYRCDPGSLAPDYAPTGDPMCGFVADEPSCDPSADEIAACELGCAPLTPNGCDCFGCCELPAHSGSFIWLGSEGPGGARCELTSALDPDVCKPCTPAPTCQNPCEECELCIGKTTLPASCGAGPDCGAGSRACDPRTQAGCGSLEYCITGCCVRSPA